MMPLRSDTCTLAIQHGHPIAGEQHAQHSDALLVNIKMCRDSVCSLGDCDVDTATFSVVTVRCLCTPVYSA